MTKGKRKKNAIVIEGYVWKRPTRKPKDSARPLPSPGNQKPAPA